MEVLKGLLYINGKDVFLTYGAYLAEEKDGDFTNYSALMKPYTMKGYTAVSFRENDGEELPEVLTPAFEPRDITLSFAIMATNKKDFMEKYAAFQLLLKSGWLNLSLPELEKTFRVYYQSCSEWTSLTPLDSGMVAAKFKIKFREPKPTI